MNTDRFSAKLVACIGVATACLSVSATELYNLQFGGSDVGTYQTVFGNPTVQSSVGPFAHALIFHAVATYDQILLPIAVAGPRYDIHYDALVHNLLSSQYSFGILLDTPDVHSLDFHGGLNQLQVYQPYLEENVGAFANDQAYHFDISVDLVAQQWSIAVDGVQVFSNALDETSLQDIRFNIGPTVLGTPNAPGVYAALDNVVVTVVPEPGFVSFCVLGVMTFAFRICSRSKSPA
jgi:hypothetical protein